MARIVSPRQEKSYSAVWTKRYSLQLAGSTKIHLMAEGASAASGEFMLDQLGETKASGKPLFTRSSRMGEQASAPCTFAPIIPRQLGFTSVLALHAAVSL